MLKRDEIAGSVADAAKLADELEAIGTSHDDEVASWMLTRYEGILSALRIAAETPKIACRAGEISSNAYEAIDRIEEWCCGVNVPIKTADVRMVIAELKEHAESARALASRSRWIPVGERMPPSGEWLTVDTDGNVEKRHRGDFNGKTGWGCSAKVTHWQPMPEGPDGTSGLPPKTQHLGWYSVFKTSGNEYERRVTTNPDVPST